MSKKNYLLVFIALLSSLSVSAQFNYHLYLLNFQPKAQDSLEFLIATQFPFGSGSNCPDIVFYETTKEADTAVVDLFYDVNHPWQTASCIAYDTIKVKRIPAVSYWKINVNAIGRFEPTDPDTTRNIDDTILYLTPLSVAHKYEQDIHCWPNPVNNILHIEGMGRADNTITLYNHYGQVVLKEKTSLQRLAIPIQHVSPGLYFLQVNNAEGYWRRKILIE